MAKLSFRQAELETGQSVGAIQNALRRGDLTSMEEDELRRWAYSRATPLQLAIVFERLNVLWSKTTALMATELMILDRQKIPFEEQAKPVRQCIRNFLITFDERPEDKYTYAEAIYFPQKKEGGLGLPRDPAFKDDLGTRASYSLFKFVRNGVFHFTDVMVQRGVIPKADEDKWFESEALHLDSFASFRKKACTSEQATEKRGTTKG